MTTTDRDRAATGSELLAPPWLGAGEDPAAGRDSLMPDGQTAWLLEGGRVELFAVELSSARAAARWIPLLRLEAPALCGPFAADADHALLLRCSPDAAVRRLDAGALAGPELDPELAAAAQRWSDGLLDALRSRPADGQEHPLHAWQRGRVKLPFRSLGADEPETVEAGELVRAPLSSTWIAVDEGAVRLLGRERDRGLAAGAVAPAGGADWILAEQRSTLGHVDIDEVAARGQLVEALAGLAHELLGAAAGRVGRLEVAEERQLGERLRREEYILDVAIDDFAAVLDERAESLRRLADSPAYLAVHLVGRHLGVPVRGPHASAGVGQRTDLISAIASASKMRTRSVTLTGRWWRHDAGPLVGTLAQEGTPVALIPTRRGYRIHDPTDGSPRRVTASIAAQLADEARQFYRPLPDRPLSAADVLRWTREEVRFELVLMLLTALGVAGVGLLAPIITAKVLGELVPHDERLQITQLCMLLLLGASVSALLSTTFNFAGLRLESRIDSGLQAAVWDRLLALPPDFYRRFSTGKLATAVLSITEARELLTGVAFKAVLQTVVVFADLVLICAYSLPLALLSLLVLAVAGTISAIGARRQLRHQQLAHRATEEINSRTFQILTGVAKINTAAAGSRAFAHWAESFAGGRRHTYRARVTQNRISAFNGGLTLLGAAAAFFVVGVLLKGLPTSTFLVFNVAFFQMLAGVVQVSTTVTLALTTVPSLQALRPILETVPETISRRADPGKLRGELTVHNLSFSYEGSPEPALEQVSFSVAPGSFTAIVGPSGCGKSTLLRLLLAFETPSRGTISYDDQDLSELDPLAVRRQCGVVLQNASLFSGDILSNIVGSGLYSQQEAWEALKMVGLDEEVGALPMGIYTMLPEGGRTLSGGQRQRLLLAQALVSRPRILLLDEATSALDNATQDIVVRSMERLKATRIIIAHRLSTVANADQIVVLDHGRLVQHGTYAELLEADGLFRELAERQLPGRGSAGESAG